MHEVAIVKANRMRREGITRAINLLGGIERFIEKGDRVAIKPNLCNSKYYYPVTTHIEACIAVLDLIKEIASEIMIIESPNASMTPKLKYKALEYDKLSDEVELVDLHKRSVLKGKDFNKLINLCNLKTSEVATITCGLKNMFGCYPNRNKAKFHSEIDNAILHINKLYPSDLVVIDALIGMEGQGPLFGTPVSMDLIIAGDNVVATDFIACQLMGINYHKVKHVTLAHKAGLGNIHNILCKGEDIDSVKKKFRMANPEPIQRRIKHFISSFDFPSRVLGKVRETVA